jgi:outer membrane protein OmpA-like peptidoglycan-associated protein
MFQRRIVLLSVVIVVAGAAVAAPQVVTLTAPQYPEKTTVQLDFSGTQRAPDARIQSKVTFREGQARIELEHDALKPAVLFGGDVTCYVVWAVSPGERAENLGELPSGSGKGSSQFGTGLKRFALMITAEPYYLVRKPSAMVMFTNQPPTKKNVPSESFAYSSFGDEPDHALDSIRTVAWDSDTPLELIQAEKAHEIAGRVGAETYAPEMYQEAKVALSQAKNLATARQRKKEFADYSRRAVALSNDAISISLGRIEAEQLEAEISQRRAEMDALESRVAEANAETARLAQERSQLESAMLALRQEQLALTDTVGSLETEKQRLAKDKAILSDRLQGALSKVADTQSTARGMIVNLPDILFDVNQSTLKDDAELVIAKLAGILLIMQDLNLRVEGHTDSTGSAAYNQRLSEQRAQSVYDFLFAQGIEAGRMKAVGYGPNRPIADNTTTEGRSRNRRVEIVIAEGIVAEAERGQ